MITLSLLKYLEDNGFGVIDESLFWQKLGLDKVGIYISDVGSTHNRGELRSTTYELYSRGTSDVQGYEQLEAIVNFLASSYGTCELPAVPPVTQEGYSNVTIMPPSTITNAGEDEQGRIVYNATGRIYY